MSIRLWYTLYDDDDDDDNDDDDDDDNNNNINNNNNNNNNNVYLIKRPYYQEPFQDAVQIICNIIIPQILCL